MHLSSSTTASITSLLFSLLLTRTTAITPNTQACHAVDGEVHNIGDVFNDAFSDLIHATWHVDVGVTFANGNGCGGISSSLSVSGIGEFDNFQCTSDGDNAVAGGGTSLSFSGIGGQGVGKMINDALTKVFPPIDGGFNCPDS